MSVSSAHHFLLLSGVSQKYSPKRAKGTHTQNLPKGAYLLKIYPKFYTCNCKLLLLQQSTPPQPARPSLPCLSGINVKDIQMYTLKIVPQHVQYIIQILMLSHVEHSNLSTLTTIPDQVTGIFY